MQHDTILYRIACKCCSEWWTENTQSHKVTESAAGRGWSIIFGRKQRCQRKRSLRLKRKRKWKWTGDQRFNMFLSDTSHMQIPASHCLQHMMFHLVLSFIIYHLIVSSSTRECGSRNSAALQVYSCENGSFLSEFCQFKPPVSTCRGVSSCCSLGWPAGWPDLYGGKNRPGWHNTCCANSVIWHQLCDAKLYIQVLCNLATLQPVSLGGTGGHSSQRGGGVAPGHPLKRPLSTSHHGSDFRGIYATSHRSRGNPTHSDWQTGLVNRWLCVKRPLSRLTVLCCSCCWQRLWTLLRGPFIHVYDLMTRE